MTGRIGREGKKDFYLTQIYAILSQDHLYTRRRYNGTY